MNDLDKIVSKSMKAIRIMNGIKQEVLAKALNVSIQQIQKYESGINRISGGNLYKLSKLFNTPITSFFSNANETPQVIGPLVKQHEAESLIRAFASIEKDELRQYILKFIKGISKIGNNDRSKE